MKRAFIGVLAFGLFLIAAGPASAAVFTYNFNSGLSPWLGARLAVPSPNALVPSTSLTQILTLRTEKSGGVENFFAGLEGHSSGLFFMYSQVTTTDNTIDIRFQARNLANCNQCFPSVYAGSGKPISFSQFRISTATLGDSWQTYGVEIPVTEANPVVAIGYRMNLTGQISQAAIDNISIETLNR